MMRKLFISVVTSYAEDPDLRRQYFADAKELRFLPGFTGEWNRETHTLNVYVVADEITPHTAMTAEWLADKIDGYSFATVVRRNALPVAAPTKGRPA